MLWVKPTNAFVWGAIKDGLSELETIGAAVLLAPFACLWSLFSSGSSCADAKKWAIKYNPIDYVAGLIPGIPIDFTGTDIGLDINGVWHFEQTAQAGNVLTFANNPSGMYYPFAGPTQVPGAVDLAIIAATSVTGVSLDAQSSWGVRDFGQFDEAGRFWTSWEAHSFDKTEFTPVSKIAKYGKKEYDSSGHTIAVKLGYPLHAFEDASFPHHIANTTSWGHRPMEDAMNNLRAQILQYQSNDDTFQDCHRPVEIIVQGYNVWSHYNMATGGHVDVEDAVENLAFGTRGWIDSLGGVWNDRASDQYLLTSSPHTDSVNSYQNGHYGGPFMDLTAFSTPLEISAAGAIIAFLVDSGLSVPNVQADPSTECPSGTSFVHGQGCVRNVIISANPTANGVTTTGRVSATPSTGGVGTSCSSNSNCAAGLVCATTGANAGKCETSGTVGTSCSSSSSCAAGLVCATTGANAGTCVASQPTVGNTCSGASDCLAPNIICGPQNTCCVVEGGSCQSNSECCAADPLDAFCDETNTCHQIG